MELSEPVLEITNSLQNDTSSKVSIYWGQMNESVTRNTLRG